MAVAIAATVLSGPAPAPVQLAITGMTSGDEYTVQGTHGGYAWPVPGGRGTADGNQLVLVDNRAPFNGDVVYTVTIAGVITSASPVQLTFDATTVLQDVRGESLATVEVTDPTDPRKRERRATLFQVAGRPDPVPRWDVALTPSMQIGVEASGVHAATLQSLLASGAPLVRRNRVGLRDIPPVELLFVTADSHRLIGAVGDLRRFDLDVQTIGDPTPFTPLVAYDWDDLDDYYSGGAWGADFDAEWSGADWDDLDLKEWV